MGRFPSILLTFFIVVLGWVIFRADTVGGAIDYYQALFTFRPGTTVLISRQGYLFFVLAILFSFLPALKIGDKWMGLFFNDASTKGSSIILFIISIVLFFLSVGALAVTDFNPFIYFRF